MSRSLKALCSSGRSSVTTAAKPWRVRRRCWYSSSSQVSRGVSGSVMRRRLLSRRPAVVMQGYHIILSGISRADRRRLALLPKDNRAEVGVAVIHVAVVAALEVADDGIRQRRGHDLIHDLDNPLCQHQVE